MFVCGADTSRKQRPVAPAAATTVPAVVSSAAATSTVTCAANGTDECVIDLTESDDETLVETNSCTAAACARTNGFVSKSPRPTHGTVSHSRGTMSHSGTVSSPSPPVAVFDLSPLNIPAASSPPIIHLPPSPLMVSTPPLLPPSLAPSGFHPAFPVPSSAKMSNIPFLGSSSSSLSSSASSSYSTLPSSAAAPSLHYPTNSLFSRSMYDSDAMLDFLTLVSGFSDFGGFSIPPNAFDYLYQSPATNSASRSDFAGLDLRGSPSPTI